MNHTQKAKELLEEITQLFEGTSHGSVAVFDVPDHIYDQLEGEEHIHERDYGEPGDAFMVKQVGAPYREHLNLHAKRTPTAADRKRVLGDDS